MIAMLAEFTWLPLDTWTVVVGMLCAMSCALLGNFLVLRRMSLMGDAISHAVLPGIAIAFLITNSRSSMDMFIGAAVVGVLTAVFTQWIHTAGKVDEGAAMGVVFTVLFAVGLILIRQTADHVDLDPECVLYGQIETVALDTIRVGGWDVPRAAATLACVLVVNALVVILFFKELRIAAFDPALGTTLGIPAWAMHYLLMTLVAITTVAAFESVGSILVIAMLIVPAAAAHLLTDRLGLMIWLSLLLAALAAAGGHVLAIMGPGWVGYETVGVSTAGMMSVVVGILFGGAFLLGPRHGLLTRVYHRAKFARRILREDILGVLYRFDEAEAPLSSELLLQILRGAFGTRAWRTRRALTGLARAGFVRRTATSWTLTDAGRAASRALVRSHRLWESYLEKHLHLPADHLHNAAERLEHVTSATMRDDLARSTDDPRRDPHGVSIPED